MTLCRFTLAPLSPWPDRLRSDSLYGLICWHAAEREGDAACRKLIEAFRAGEPPFELSSAMPENRLPMPLSPPIRREDFRKLAEKFVGKDETREEALFRLLQKYKKFRKRAWLPLEAWENAQGRLSPADFFASSLSCEGDDESGGESEKKKIAFSKSAFEPHVSIDRRTGTARAGELFFRRLQYFRKDAKFHLYARAEDPQYLLRWLRIIGDVGFGRDAGVGNGRFEAGLDESFRSETLDSPDANARLLLSVCAAPEMTDLQGFYKLEAKQGKTGPGHRDPFKNPFLMLTEGSLLTAPLAGPFVLEGVSADPRVVQILQPLTLPCRLVESSEEAA